MKTHYIIPVFIPGRACPFSCIYCNQYKITDHVKQPDSDEINKTIENYLRTFPENAVKRVGFFGGSFTGMSIKEQNMYLDVVQPYIKEGLIDEIQLSTRPDYINEDILDNLKEHHVSIVELGAQSLNKEVLRMAGRGHSVEDVERASKMINAYGFDLGLQMMIGLPGDTYETTMETAAKLVELGARNTRIYPTLVIKDTILESMYINRQYIPLTLDEATDWCKDLVVYFEEHNVLVLRVGLHPSEGLMTGEALISGPFHVSFKQLVMTKIWREKLERMIKGNKPGDDIEIHVPLDEINYAIGYGSSNRKWLKTRFKNVRFIGEYRNN